MNLAKGLFQVSIFRMNVRADPFQYLIMELFATNHGYPKTKGLGGV